MFEKGQLRIFEPKTEETTGGWRWLDECTVRSFIIHTLKKYH
jgi:hypothetical protein